MKLRAQIWQQQPHISSADGCGLAGHQRPTTDTTREVDVGETEEGTVVCGLLTEVVWWHEGWVQ